MAFYHHAAARCKGLKGYQCRNASQFTSTKGKKDEDSLSHPHTRSNPFTLLLHSTSSTRMLAIALIKAVNERNIHTSFCHISFCCLGFKLTAYITPKDKIQSVTECVIILTSLQFTWI